MEAADSQDSGHSGLDDERSEAVRNLTCKIVDCTVWRVPTFTVFALAFMTNALGRSAPLLHMTSVNTVKPL